MHRENENMHFIMGCRNKGVERETERKAINQWQLNKILIIMG